MPTAEPDVPVPLAELYRDHAAFLKRFILCRGFDAASVEDLVQDTFTVAHRLGGYRPGPAAPRSWLCAIAIRLAANEYRAQRRRGVLRASLEGVPGTNACAPDALFSRRKIADKIEQALSELTSRQQRCLLSFYVDEHACEDIARNERVPIGTIYSRLNAARNNFSRVYEENDF